MAQKKIPSQTNLVDLLAITGRGILGTLSNRFSGYDAAVEKVNAHDTTLTELDYQHTKTRSLAESNAGEIQDNHNEITTLKSKVSTLESSNLPWLEVTADGLYNTLMTSAEDYTLDITQYVPANAKLSDYCGVKITDTAMGIVFDCPYIAYIDAESQAFLGIQQVYVYTLIPTLDLAHKQMTFVNLTRGIHENANRITELENKLNTSGSYAPQQPMTLLVCGDTGNTTDMLGDTFTLTPTKMKDGSVDYFAVRLTDQMASGLKALFIELNKAQNPHGSDVYVADTNPVNMLPTLMLTFYDGSIAYRFDAVESSPGNEIFVFKGEIIADNGSLATWVAIFASTASGPNFEFILTK